jgi:hypothetical protein
MKSDHWIEETYFDWLRREAFSEVSERREYEGILRVLHNIPFYWTIWSDENRAGDALSYRLNDFLGSQTGLESVDQHWLHDWGEGTPSVLEVLLGIARRWHLYFEGSVPFYFGHLFLRMEFDRFPGRVLRPESVEAVQEKCDVWMSRQFEPNGDGSPFPIQHALQIVDMRTIGIWEQMNAYSAEHFQ